MNISEIYEWYKVANLSNNGKREMSTGEGLGWEQGNGHFVEEAGRLAKISMDQQLEDQAN